MLGDNPRQHAPQSLASQSSQLGSWPRAAGVALRGSGATPDFPCVKVKQSPIFETDTRIVRLPMHLVRLTEVMKIAAIPGRGLTAAEVLKATGLLWSTYYKLLHSLVKHRSINEPVVQCSCCLCREKLSGGDPQRIHEAYEGAPRNRIRTDRRTALSRMRSDIYIDVSSKAAPVLIGHIGASVSVGAVGPVRHFREACRKEIGEELQQNAAKISATRRKPITTSTLEEE